MQPQSSTSQLQPLKNKLSLCKYFISCDAFFSQPFFVPEMIIKPRFERSLESIFGVNGTNRAVGGFLVLCGLVYPRSAASLNCFGPLYSITPLGLSLGVQLSGGGRGCHLNLHVFRHLSLIHQGGWRRARGLRSYIRQSGQDKRASTCFIASILHCSHPPLFSPFALRLSHSPQSSVFYQSFHWGLRSIPDGTVIGLFVWAPFFTSADT